MVRRQLLQLDDVAVRVAALGHHESGKSTTLYSALSSVNTPDTNIMTAEEAKEYGLVDEVLLLNPRKEGRE